MKKTISNQRKLIYNTTTKLIFGGYIIFTLIFVIFAFGELFMNTAMSIISPAFSRMILNLKPTTIFLVFFLWTLYGYFMAFTYASNKIQGIIFRMSSIFDLISSGEIHKMTFRKNDPFHDVAKSFNTMIQKIHENHEIKKDLLEISKNSDIKTKEKIEELINKL
ncbi:MAG: hypothetical protein ACD_79C00781G0004 [uncultured bacterium]|nr:MAG: hypothetical protein ACD_79C00781G0004 [uncultured bacterium]